MGGKKFFPESNLTALREMALRVVAEHVDRDLREIMAEQRIRARGKAPTDCWSRSAPVRTRND